MKIKTGLDLLLFLAGVPQVVALWFFPETTPNGHSPADLQIQNNFYFLVGVTHGNFCAERTPSTEPTKIHDTARRRGDQDVRTFVVYYYNNSTL
jgi:hypothetical protein